MKKLFVAASVTILAILASLTTSTNGTTAPSVYVEPAASYIQPGDAGKNISINVSISSLQDVYAAELEVIFNTSALSLLEAREGGFLSKDGNSTFKVINSTAGPSGNGKITYASTRVGQVGGVSGSGSLLEMVFNIKSAANSQIGVAFANMVNQSMQPTAPQVSNGSIIVNSPPAAPVIRVYPINAQKPVTSDDLSCLIDANSTDADGDAVTYSYSWYRNGILQEQLKSATVNNLLTNRSEDWKCLVTPWDGKAMGQGAEANATIRNSNPMIDFTSLNPKTTRLVTRRGVPINFSIRFTDIDNDPLNYKWYEIRENNLSRSPILSTNASWTFNTSACYGTKSIWGCADDGSSLSCFIFYTIETNLRGDVNKDGKVDLADLSTVGMSYGSKYGGAGWNKNADVSPLPTQGENEGDGKVNIMDLAEVGLGYGSTVS